MADRPSSDPHAACLDQARAALNSGCYVDQLSKLVVGMAGQWAQRGGWQRPASDRSAGPVCGPCAPV